MNKKDNIMSLFLILIGLISCILPIIFNYNSQLTIMSIAGGIAFISNEIIENKIIKRIIAFVGIIVILYGYFKLGV